jgi:ceramide glucosyltransferase
MHSLLWLIWIQVGVSTAWVVAGLGALLVTTRRSRSLLERPPSVSVLKPLCGADPDLRLNLESFFRQDHTSIELIFGAVQASDPALEVVRDLARKYPHVPCQIVVHEGEGALNPKVNNLLGLLPRARFDLVLLSDSNVRAPAHYVRELATLYAREKPGLVTNLFVGVGETTLGGALENVQLAGFCAEGTALAMFLGDPVLVGKSVLFSHRRLEELGGLRRLSDVLAEDFVMGKTFTHAGHRVLVAPTVLDTVTRGLSLRTMLARHLRWSMMRFRLLPIAAVLEPAASPLLLMPFAWLVLGPWAVAWAAALLVLRDVGGWVVLRGPSRWYLPLVLSPLRELVMLGIWCVAPHKQHVAWRGKRFRLGAGTLLYLDRNPQSRINRWSSTPAPAITRS